MDLTQQTWDGERYIEADASKRQIEGPFPLQTKPDVLAAYAWPTNAHLIADVARLGYIGENVLDVTYGEGGFWTRFQPKTLAGHTLDRARVWVDGEMVFSREEAFDFRSINSKDAWFDTVVFDPPYKLNGTPAMGAMDKRYGTQHRQSEGEIMEDIFSGLVECARVCAPKGHVLVKCKDQVVAGRVVWQTQQLTNIAKDFGLTLVDRFDMLRTPIPQRGRQVHARRNYSTLLVFRKVK